MASTQANLDVAPEVAAPASSLLVSLTSLPQGALETALANLALAFPAQTVLVATPDAVPGISSGGPLRLVQYAPQVASSASWLLTAADFLNTLKLVEEQQAAACLLLGPESHTLQPEAIRALATSALTFDLTVARYTLGPHEGLVNSAILFPVTRALFGTRPRFPLAIDLGLSLRMVTRMASVAQKFIGTNQPEALLWPVSEAAAAGYSISEADIGPRAIPHAAAGDLNSQLALITGSLFAEVDAKASFWQRARTPLPLRQPLPPLSAAESAPDVSSMIETFRLAYANLHDIWALVLPPNSLLGLKKLHASPATSFRMPDELWTRIVYDFILAYRLRTINRGHLLGALTPLYLAWAASHLMLTASNTPTPEQHIQEQAAAFEISKPYFVSRWRWPDRFNP
ncbi:hypothetical protein [Edaphobacter sp.]|uniref:hypothetical protein n=1 Tax=Edaphobacter sp. TaxID=1934404 RepID=UPI002DBDE59F|nr:hypothetical protein [Edaphobacter sp.]HEU5340672.1 hypothetical protein [Edaphobacter sp.]